VALRRLWLRDFRNYVQADFTPAPTGLTVIRGGNAEGKTNLLEAVGYLATLSSFRHAPTDALVRRGCQEAVVRAEAVAGERDILIEAEISPGRRDRVLVNRQRLQRTRDLLGALRVSVFSPDDLSLVQGGPAERRRYLDEGLVSLHPRHDSLQSEVDRVLRQRGALLKQAAGRLAPEIAATLDVWDAKLARAGEQLVAARRQLVADLEPAVTKAYDQLAASAGAPALAYRCSWEGSLADALAVHRVEDLRRAMTTVGPHRDDVVLGVDGLAARTYASRGEQRCLALALRLALHAAVTETIGTAPVLLLDDVFSELDADRSEALLAHLPLGQALLSTAGSVPAGAVPALSVRVVDGCLL